MRKAYRYIDNLFEEGFQFFLLQKYVVQFFTKEMRAQTRKDGPDTLIKYSRDWEYPWVLMKSEVKPGDKVLDCGAGYSPIPFIWSSFGAKVCAVDRDILIATKLSYGLRCFATILKDVIKFFNKAKSQDVVKNLNIEDKDKPKKPFLIKFITYFRVLLGRIWKSDFWGPIPPAMIKKYDIDYIIGDFTKLSFEDCSFDVVSCVSVLEHMPHDDQIRGIKEMARVVKNGGKLIITYDNHVDLTDTFINNSGLTPSDLVYYYKPKNLYNDNFPDVIGICLLKNNVEDNNS